MAIKKTIKPKVSLVLYTSKKYASGKHPIMLRVYYNKKVERRSTNLQSIPAEWDSGKERFKNDKLSNAILDKISSKANNILLTMELEEIDFSFDGFFELFEKTDKIKVSFFDYLEDLIERLMKEDRISYARSHKDLRNVLKRFHPKSNLLFVDINLKFLMKFDEFLRDFCKVNTIGIYMRTLKAVCNKSIVEGISGDDYTPFRGYKIKTEVTRKRAISKNQMVSISSFETDKGSKERLAQDLFVFSYLTMGMNFIDIAKLKWKENISNGRIVYNRSKTKTAYNIKIQGKLEGILKDQKKMYGKEGFIFPIIHDKLSANGVKNTLASKLKKTNKIIKEISKELKFPNYDEITFYVARHTWATVQKRRGNTTALIQEGLGHKTEKTTQIYLDSFEHEALDEINEGLLD